MHACMHTYIICIHTYMHTYMHTYIHKCHTYIHKHITHTYTNTYLYNQTYMHTCTNTCVSIHKHISIQQTNIHTYTNTYVPVLPYSHNCITHKLLQSPFVAYVSKSSEGMRKLASRKKITFTRYVWHSHHSFQRGWQLLRNHMRKFLPAFHSRRTQIMYIDQNSRFHRKTEPGFFQVKGGQK
jgi:hypothetical protein